MGVESIKVPSRTEVNNEIVTADDLVKGLSDPAKREAFEAKVVKEANDETVSLSKGFVFTIDDSEAMLKSLEKDERVDKLASIATAEPGATVDLGELTFKSNVNDVKKVKNNNSLGLDSIKGKSLGGSESIEDLMSSLDDGKDVEGTNI